MRSGRIKPAAVWRIFILLCGFSAAAYGEIRLEDDLGSQVVLAAPAQRIISLAPNITEMLYFVGAGDRIIGADEYSNYPEEAKNILRVNNYQAANYELILSLKPDLVIAWHSGNGDQIIARLRQLGLPVFVIEPRRLDDIARIFHQFGVLSGLVAGATQKAEAFNDELASLRGRYEQAAPVRVFYQIWNEPLITLNGKHLVSDVIRLCGGVNVFGDAIPLVPYVNIEAVIRANPQVIVASGSSDASPQWLQMWRDWPAIDAVQHNRVYAIPPDLMQRHSMRILEGAQSLCQFLDGARQ
ncbi:MAG: cobalamin-binding protein [Porticoccaceae bacterium]|jgi:iron complex transport system substrate-binding protein